MDFASTPDEPMPVLHPFEIVVGDSGGIAENVRHGKDALSINNGVGLPGGGPVGALTKNLALPLVSVLFGDLVFDGRGDKHTARLEENVARAHLGAASREVLQRFLLSVNPVDHLGYVEAVLVVQTTADIGKADDFIAGFLHQVRRKRA